MYKRRIFIFEEIEPILYGRDTFLLSNYFWKEIDNFEIFIKSKDKPADFEESFLENENENDQMMEYGFQLPVLSIVSSLM